MEEESPILKEIPVFISQTLVDKLVLYQYPLEQGGLNTDNANVIQCSIKQNPHEISLELERNTDSTNYCTSRGEQIAINVDGQDTSTKTTEEITFPRNLMDRQMFVSRSLTHQNCAVGIFHDNELHLNPLESVALLRPCFKYLDKSDKRAKSEAKDGQDGEVSGEDEEEAKQVTVKFARQESERTKKAREKSFGYVNKMTAKEIWYKANYYNQKTDKSEMEMSRLYCSKTSEKANESTIEMSELLAVVSKDEDDSAAANASHGLSLGGLKCLPLVERVRKLLLDARLVQFNELTAHLGCTSADLSEHLKAVQQVAVLVQGCWVVQSDVIYSKDTLPGGVPSALMRGARDYMLYLFTKHKAVTRRKILDTVRLPASLVHDMLSDVAVLVQSTKEWEFKLQPDAEFIKSYPEVVQRQYIKWEMKYEQLLDAFKNTETNFTSSPPTRHRRKSHRDSSFSSDNESDSRKNGYQISAHKMRRTKTNSFSSADPIPTQPNGSV